MARHACTNPPMLSQLFTETLRGKVAAVVYDFNVALPRVNTLPSPRSVKWNTRKDFVYISSERGFVLSNDDLERLIFQYLLLLSRLRVIFVRFFSLLLYIYIFFLLEILIFRGNFTNLIFSAKSMVNIFLLWTKENSIALMEEIIYIKLESCEIRIHTR